MKKFRYLKLFVIGGIAVFASSCSKDFLEIDPYGKSDGALYYNTDKEINMGVIAAYDFIHSDQFDGWSSTFFIKQLPGDDTNCGGSTIADQAKYQAIDDFKWVSDNAAVKAFYRINYYGITRCNDVINNAKSSSSLGKRLVAEAKFLRAYFYFELTTVYGDVPLRLKSASSISEGGPRVAQSSIYAQIIKDLDEAIVDLKNKDEYAKEDRFRANIQAAQALKGKVLLYQKKYAESAATFALVVAKEGSMLGLESDFSVISKSVSNFGKESLFEAVFVSENKNWGNADWNRNADDNRHIILQGPRNDGGSYSPGTSGINAGWGFNPPTMKLYNAFDPADKRRLATVITTSELESLYSGKFVDGWDCEGAIRTKYTTFESETNGANGNVPELNYSVHWKLIRYSDVLLMYAEALLQSGDAPNALIEFNKVHANVRTGLPALSSLTMNDIVKERQVELAYEGVRFWDLVRWDLADQELKSLGFIKGIHEHFPIPMDEMVGNSSIGAQNTGY